MIPNIPIQPIQMLYFYLTKLGRCKVKQALPQQAQRQRGQP
jgi:hypothetical protein